MIGLKHVKAFITLVFNSLFD